jgi:biopolymer transport protein ExbD
MNRHIFIERHKKNTIKINMTPLIDIVFTLLIFFAISTSLTLNKLGIKLTLPKASTVSVQKVSSKIIINQQQEIFLDNLKIELKDLSKYINQLKFSQQDLQIILSADQQIPYNLLIEVLDQIRLGNCYNIVFEADILKPN